jgi:hypothetical protein
MPISEVVGVVVGDPRRAGRVLPDQRIERQVEPDGWSGQQERSARFRIAKKELAHRRHREPGTLRVAREVDVGKENQLTRVHERSEPSCGLGHRMRASDSHDAMDGYRSRSRSHRERPELALARRLESRSTEG